MPVPSPSLVLIQMGFQHFSRLITDLLLRAEINAYFAEGVQPLPDNIAAMLRDATQTRNNPKTPSLPDRSEQEEK